MRRGFWVAAVAFGVTLALLVGLRLEERSLAVVVGVVCGILAALPVTGVVLSLWWRERQERLQAEERPQVPLERPAAPPVIILNAGRGMDRLPPARLLGEQGAREFTIVGEEEHHEQGDLPGLVRR